MVVPTNDLLIQPPPSYETAVSTPTTRNTNKRLQQFHIFGARPNCHCQHQQLLATHQQPRYDLVKKCRQCRRIIRDYHDSDSEDSGNEYCQCLLQNTPGQETVDDEATDMHHGHDVVQTNTCLTYHHHLAIEDDASENGANIDRCESEDVLDDSGLPSYRAAAKLELIGQPT